jgi:hypothetical protein
MKMNFPEIDNTPPKGKRSVRSNVWGNTNGYIAGRFWVTLGGTYDVGTDAKVAEFLAAEERK